MFKSHLSPRKWLLGLTLAFVMVGFASSQSTTKPAVNSETLELEVFARRLLDAAVANPRVRITVIASNLNPKLQPLISGLVHGWCENQFLLACGIAHPTVAVRVLTGDEVKEPWREAATRSLDNFPWNITNYHQAEVTLLKSTPSRTLWILEDAKGGDWLVTGTTLSQDDAGLINVTTAPFLGTGMLKQLFVDQAIASGTRWAL
jgi:hypothetical protein